MGVEILGISSAGVGKRLVRFSMDILFIVFAIGGSVASYNR